MNNYLFFWGGPCSQWTESPFAEFDTTFNCAEQFMMAAKAKVFSDDATYDLIMATNNPKEQKALGRKVQGFDARSWNDIARDYVTLANYNKFTQNHDLLEYLMENRDKHFVEASPYDKIWGIGMGIGDPLIEDPANWKGTNWLGECIDMTRDIILQTAGMDQHHVMDVVRKELDWR